MNFKNKDFFYDFASLRQELVQEANTTTINKSYDKKLLESYLFAKTLKAANKAEKQKLKEARRAQLLIKIQA